MGAQGEDASRRRVWPVMSDTHGQTLLLGAQHEGRAPRDLSFPPARRPAACDSTRSPSAPSHLPSNCKGAWWGKGGLFRGASWPSQSCSAVDPQPLTFAPSTPGAIFPLTHVSREVCAKGGQEPQNLRIQQPRAQAPPHSREWHLWGWSGHQELGRNLGDCNLHRGRTATVLSHRPHAPGGGEPPCVLSIQGGLLRKSGPVREAGGRDQPGTSGSFPRSTRSCRDESVVSSRSPGSRSPILSPAFAY